MVVNLVGGLDNYGNCEVGLFGVRGMPLRSQVVTAANEIYIRQEWARINNLMGSIKLSEHLMGTTTDRTLVNSGEGTYVWDYCTLRPPALTRWSACTEPHQGSCTGTHIPRDASSKGRIVQETHISLAVSLTQHH